MTIRWPSEPAHEGLDSCHCMYCGCETGDESVMALQVGQGTKVLLANVCSLDCLARWSVLDLIDRARLEALRDGTHG